MDGVEESEGGLDLAAQDAQAASSRSGALLLPGGFAGATHDEVGPNQEDTSTGRLSGSVQLSSA
jgi:hypothetical protein